MRQIASSVGYVLLFLVVLLGAAALSSRIDPFREVEGIREKYAWWQAHKDEYDTVFIGTSRTNRGIMPSLFDQMTAEAGVPTKSFNFGVDGMIGPEDAYVADYVLRNPPKNLRWVFFEVAKFGENFEVRDPSNVRTRHWHDWTNSWLCIRAVLWPNQKKAKMSRWFQPDSDQPWPADTAWTHLRLFTTRALNLGRGAAKVEEWLVPPRDHSDLLGPKGDGFVPYPPGSELKGAAATEYEKALVFRKQNPAKVSELKYYHQEALDNVLEAIRETGAKPVTFLAPSVGSIRFKPAERPGVAMIDFYDPVAFPEMYESKIRVDMQHLNADGAVVFTRRLAEHFIPLAKAAAGSSSTQPSR